MYILFIYYIFYFFALYLFKLSWVPSIFFSHASILRMKSLLKLPPDFSAVAASKLGPKTQFMNLPKPVLTFCYKTNYHL